MPGMVTSSQHHYAVAVIVGAIPAWVISLSTALILSRKTLSNNARLAREQASLAAAQTLQAALFGMVHELSFMHDERHEVQHGIRERIAKEWSELVAIHRAAISGRHGKQVRDALGESAELVTFLYEYAGDSDGVPEMPDLGDEAEAIWYYIQYEYYALLQIWAIRFLSHVMDTLEGFREGSAPASKKPPLLELPERLSLEPVWSSDGAHGVIACRLSSGFDSPAWAFCTCGWRSEKPLFNREEDLVASLNSSSADHVSATNADEAGTGWFSRWRFDERQPSALPSR